MRLFVAVVPPPAVTDRVRAALAPLEADVRWTEPVQWHVTLSFLGEVADGLVDPLAAALGALRHPAPVLRVRGAGRFGDRVLWAGLDGDLGVLGGLAAEVSALARAQGVEVDDRPYRPHLTLAFGSGLAPLVRALRGLETDSWRVGEMVLFRSRPGPVYDPLGVFSVG